MTINREDRFFFRCGLVMVFSEVWKQLCLTFQLNHGHYQWWYFPFQLCSIPMYLCVLLPFVRSDFLKRSFLTFLMTFGLIGGFFAFFDTSGMHYPFFPLTVHSYLWHILLILIGLKAGFYTSLEHSLPEYCGALCIYLSCCLGAIILNTTLYSRGTINMFYINPFYKMNQAVFREIAEKSSNSIGITAYIASTIFGSFLVFHFASKKALSGKDSEK